MRKKYLALALSLCACGAAVTTTAYAEGGARTVPPPNAEQLVLARQAALEMSAITLGSMKIAIKSGQEARTQGFYAGALAAWARALPSMFPAGTAAGETPAQTKAKPDIWNNRDDFNARAAAFAAATARLTELVSANDTDGFQAQLANIKQTCDACHQSYQAR